MLRLYAYSFIYLLVLICFNTKNMEVSELAGLDDPVSLSINMPYWVWPHLLCRRILTSVEAKEPSVSSQSMKQQWLRDQCFEHVQRTDPTALPLGFNLPRHLWGNKPFQNRSGTMCCKSCWLAQDTRPILQLRCRKTDNESYCERLPSIKISWRSYYSTSRW